MFGSDFDMTKETKAKLDDGRIVLYDACDKTENAYNTKYFELIGHGVVYSVAGVKQSGTLQRYFYKRIDRS